MDNALDSMLEAYLFEASDLLEHLDGILLECEKQNEFDADSINEIFRIMHTIKGSSAMMEFDSLTTVSHKIEDLFAYVRESGVNPEYNSALFDLLFRAGDFLKMQISRLENGESPDTDVEALAQEIDGFLGIISGKASAPAPSAAPADAASSVPAPAPSSPAGAGGGVRVFFDEAAGMQNLRAFMLANSLSESFSDFSYEPADIQTNPATAEEVTKSGFLLRFNRTEDLQKALKTIESFNYTSRYELEEPEPNRPEGAGPAETASPAAGAAGAAEKKPGAAKTAAPGKSAKQNLINVNLSKLDSLMDLMGEIVITESMVTSIQSGQGGAIDNNFNKASRQLRKLTDELQEIVMSIRMVPVASVFQKMNRIVRDMSKKLDKDIDLVLVGEETEVDKTIVDNIADPLMHLVRNSMDHGLEPAEERVKAGKPPRGVITLSAQNTGGEILITVQDDGRGIDRDTVLKKAKRLGLLKKPEGDYLPREIYDFLLMPGFSTNEVVTEYSGRGVGMDVVKKNVEKIGGDVRIESEVGMGTKTTFKIPLTLAIVNGMKVTVGSTVFTIPINNIRQSFRMEETSLVKNTAGEEIVMLRDQYYPLVRLDRLFDIPGAVEKLGDGIVMLVGTHETTYCVFVDALLGEQQVVLKSLPVYLNQYHIKRTGISGCAILGDGSISLILDIQNLYQNN